MGVPVLEWVFLFGIGFAVGVYAGSVGAGGGFLFAPILLLRYPEALPEEITTATLAAVAVANAAAAAYAWMHRRVDRPLSGALVAAALPAALVGAAATSLMPRVAFALAFGLLLAFTGIYLARRPVAEFAEPLRAGWQRELRDRAGVTFQYRVPVWRSLFAAAAAAGVSTLVGLGGGLFYTPLAVRVMRIPHALAVPTAQVLITAVSTGGVALHLLAGHTGDPLNDMPFLTAGVIASVPLARRLHDRLGEGLLTRALAAGIFLVGVQTAALAFF